jgi:lycopene cyclase domain-containing protein
MVTLAALLAMTAIFDNLIIMSGIVDYNHTLLLGVYIGVAPVEDFFYAILAVILVPALWHSIDKENT